MLEAQVNDLDCNISKLVEDEITQDMFPEIVCSYVCNGQLCRRFHYADVIVNDKHTKFMTDRGWKDTGESLFNSGNGNLHIWRKKLTG